MFPRLSRGRRSNIGSVSDGETFLRVPVQRPGRGRPRKMFPRRRRPRKRNFSDGETFFGSPRVSDGETFPKSGNVSTSARSPFRAGGSAGECFPVAHEKRECCYGSDVVQKRQRRGNIFKKATTPTGKHFPREWFPGKCFPY